MIEDPFYLALFGEILDSIRRRTPVRAELFDMRSLNVGEGQSFARFLQARLLGKLTSAKWRRLYHSFSASVGYSSTSFSPLLDAWDLGRAWRAWKRVETVSELTHLVVDNILLGDLINDSYLRFKPREAVDLADRYLLLVIWQSLRDLRRARKYFSPGRQRLYLASYSSYIQHGVAVRVALDAGIPVLCFGNYQELAKRLEPTDSMHTKQADHYASDFQKLDRQAERLGKAEAELSGRVQGRVDSATAYMKTTSYGPSGPPVEDVRGAVIVFLHDFYDSPHAYHDMIFPDFWEWACFTLSSLEAAGIPYFVKPHPNQIELSQDAIEKLQDRFPTARFLSAATSNSRLAAAGMACAVTMYGTVAHEMAYLGIPSISCARHPHVSFSFSITATSRASYGAELARANAISFDPVRARAESLAFYYMHNLHMDPEELELRDSSLDLRHMAASSEVPDGQFISRLQSTVALPAFERFVSTCVALMGHDAEASSCRQVGDGHA